MPGGIRIPVRELFGAVPATGADVVPLSTGHVPFPLALSAARKTYPADPVTPPSDAAKQILARVRDLLDLPLDQAGLVRLYAVSEGALAEIHGLDGWLEMDGGEDEPPFIVTFAFVHGPTGRGTRRADVEIDGEATVTAALVNCVAMAVCHTLADKIRDRKTQ